MRTFAPPSPARPAFFAVGKSRLVAVLMTSSAVSNACFASVPTCAVGPVIG